LYQNPESPRLRVCAVSYLNTVPLVWGMLRGAQAGLFDLEFRIPSECADRLASGAADIGIVPAFELSRQPLEIISGAGIACHGPVRSILLISSCTPDRIRTLAADSSSRTSTQLARVILERRYGTRPRILPHPPDLARMLQAADAALVIGDPALHIDPAAVPGTVLDLGEEWVQLTGLPMVFAVWAGRQGCITPAVAAAFRDSCRFGKDHLEEIVAEEAPRRNFSAGLVREYLTRQVVHELGAEEYRGMELFLQYANACTPAGLGASQ
jgi:predicted solute-binding protein